MAYNALNQVIAPSGAPLDPISVNVISGGGSNASVGTNGATAPTSSTEVGFIDGSGNLQGVSSANPLPVTGGGSTPYTDGAAAPAHPLGTTLEAVYNTTPPAPASGQWVTLQADSQGDIKVYLAAALAGEDLTFINRNGNKGILGVSNVPVLAAGYSPSVDVSFGSAVTHNSKATPGNILAITATNINAAVRYFQLFNATSATGTPIFSFPLPAGTSTAPSTLILDQNFFTSNGYYFSTAISWGISTAAGTYSGATAADHQVNLLYV